MDPALGLGWDVEVLTAEQETSMNIVRIGLDLAKYVFHLHGVDDRLGVAPFFANLPRCVVIPIILVGLHIWRDKLWADQPHVVTKLG